MLRPTLAVDTGSFSSHKAIQGLFADFSGGAPGVPVTIYDPSLTPFDSMAQGASASMVYDAATVLAPMTRTIKLTTSAPAINYLTWNSFGQVRQTTYGRDYIYMTAAPNQNWRFVQWFAAAASRGFIEIQTTRKVRIADQTATIVATSATTLATNTWYRLEWSVTRSATAGIVSVSIYPGHDAIPVETFSSPGFNTGAFIDQVSFGSVNNSGLGTSQVFIGAFADACLTQPGVYDGPPTPAAAFSNQQGVTAEVEHSGDFVLRAAQSFILDGGRHRVSPGDAMLRHDGKGNIFFGPSPMTLGDPTLKQSILDGAFSTVTGRFFGNSYVAQVVNDPPDLTFIRVGGGINADRSGTDGVTNGSTLQSATANFKSWDRGKEILVGGVQGYYIASVDSPTQVTLQDVNGDPVALANASGVAWESHQSQYPTKLFASFGGAGQTRWQPFAFPFQRTGTDGVVNGTTTFTAASGSFSAADTGRRIMVNNDTARIYTMTYASPTTVTLDRADPNTASGLAWAITSSRADGNARRAAINSGTIGGNFIEEPCEFAASGKSYAPMSISMLLADKKLYPDGQTGDTVMVWRYDGRVEINKRLTFTDATVSVDSTSPPTDAQMWRPASGRIQTNARLEATGGIGVGNSAVASTLGSVVRKIQVFDTSGNSLGFLPVYGSIT